MSKGWGRRGKELDGKVRRGEEKNYSLKGEGKGD